MSSHAGIYDIFWYYGTNNTKVKLNQMHMLQKALTLVAVVFSEDLNSCELNWNFIVKEMGRQHGLECLLIQVRFLNKS